MQLRHGEDQICILLEPIVPPGREYQYSSNRVEFFRLCEHLTITRANSIMDTFQQLPRRHLHAALNKCLSASRAPVIRALEVISLKSGAIAPLASRESERARSLLICLQRLARTGPDLPPLQLAWCLADLSTWFECDA